MRHTETKNISAKTGFDTAPNEPQKEPSTLVLFRFAETNRVEHYVTLGDNLLVVVPALQAQARLASRESQDPEHNVKRFNLIDFQQTPQVLSLWSLSRVDISLSATSIAKANT